MVHYGKPPQRLIAGEDYFLFRNDEIWYDSIIDIYNVEPDAVYETKYGRTWRYNNEYQIPLELKKALMSIRKKILASLDDNWKPDHYVKYAQLHFIYRNQVYVIYPKTMGLEDYKYPDEFFGSMHYYIEARLKKILGIEYKYYDDFLA